MENRRYGARALLMGIAIGVTLTAGASRSVAHAQNVSLPKIAASVNGELITESAFYERLQRVRAQDFIASVNPLQLRGETAGQIVLTSMINEKLIVQWATKTGQMPSDAEVAAEVETLKKQPGLADAIKAGAVTEENLRYDVTVQRARFNLATTAASVTPQEVEAWYKAHQANYTTPERWGLAAVRTSKPDSLPKIAAAIKANKPFPDIVKEYSEDSKNKETGGMLGVVSAADNNVPAPIREAVKKLKVGEITPAIKFDLASGPEKTPGTVWLFVRLVSKEPEKVRPFEDVKSQAERLALLEKAGGYQVADKKIATFREQSKIQISLPAYQSLAPKPKTT